MAKGSDFISRGLYSALPAGSITGQLYYATDRGIVYRYNGATWDIFSTDINGLTADASPDSAADYILSYDASAGVLKKVLISDMPASAGGGDSTYTAAYASRPAAGSDGDLFFPSNGFSMQRDTGAEWFPWGPLWPMAQPPAASGWTWINQGTATVADTAGGLRLLALNDTTGTNWHLLHKAQPAKPYKITVALTTNISNSQYGGVGIGWLNSSSGSFVILQISFDGHVGPTKYTNYSTFSAHYNNNYVPVSKPQVWFLRIEDNNTSRIASISFDGVNFTALHTVGNTDFITADKVFFAVCSNNTFSTSVTILSWKEE